MSTEGLFWELYKAPVEGDVLTILSQQGYLHNPDNWRPYGNNESNYGVVENQQASPIPALIEKVTNGIDAILMRMCIEKGIDPKSKDAPRSIDEAIEQFFPDHKNWDLRMARRQQAERLQILADGPRMETSLIIYDDGEGQNPSDFENTFLSLLRGNKNDIHFVQGKYNMGGAGAVAFCGKRRYQLICSRRFDSKGPFGFTLVRRHPLTAAEETTKKSTWYEYLVINGNIPSFSASDLDLGLYNRRFTSGTVIKLYSYDLPTGSRSVISRDLNQSINEYLFNPALPVFTIDKEDRYPKDRELERELYGLRRRLEEDDSRYVDEYFSEDVEDEEIGRLRITCYTFKPRVGDRSVKETRETIQREFFKNNMSVLFSMNGQVHGNYTSEFITRSLKLPLLKNYLLIHVDCTDVHTEFRNELFMASRDRLKEGNESRSLRGLSDALAVLHEKAIHRDIKPENILVSGDKWLLSDYGLCSQVAADEEDITPENGNIGPKFWLSPEAHDKRLRAGGEICKASDVYQLAAIIWYLINGKHPSGILTNSDWKGPDNLRQVIMKALMHDKNERQTDGTMFHDEIELAVLV